MNNDLKIYLILLMMSVSWALRADSTMVVGVMIEPPFVVEDDEGNLSGLSIDLWENIAESRGVSFRYKQYYDHLSILRSLDFSEISIGINPLHVNEMRLKMLKASQPFFVSNIGVAVGGNESKIFANFFKNIFSYDFLKAVSLLVVVIFIVGLILWMVERRDNRRQFRDGLPGLFDGLWWAAVTMTTVGYGDKAPKTRAGKVIAMIWMFTAIIIISSFTASIASALTVNSLSHNINTIEDVKNSNRVATVFASSGSDFLKNHDITADLVFNDIKTAIKALSSGKAEVLVYDRAVLQYYIDNMDVDQNVVLLPKQFNRQYKSFFVPKYSDEMNWINPLLVRQINDVKWQETLAKYQLASY